MLGQIFQSSSQAIPTPKLRQQWDRRLREIKKKRPAGSKASVFSENQGFLNVLTAEPVLRSAFERDSWLARKRLARRALAEASCQEEHERARSRARRSLLEERFRMARRLFWEWEGVARKGYEPSGPGWEKSDYLARRSHGWTVMNQLQYEMSTLPC